MFVRRGAVAMMVMPSILVAVGRDVEATCGSPAVAGPAWPPLNHDVTSDCGHSKRPEGLTDSQMDVGSRRVAAAAAQHGPGRRSSAGLPLDADLRGVAVGIGVAVGTQDDDPIAGLP